MACSMSAMAAEVATRPTHFWRDRLCAPTLCSSALSGSTPPPRRRLFVETWASCDSPLSSGLLITEALAGPPGLSRTQKRLLQRRTQFQRLRDGSAWQRADEVREVFVQFQRALQQALGQDLKTMTSLPSTHASGAQKATSRTSP